MSVTCLNCGAIPSGQFCQSCGQRAGLQPFTFRLLLQQVPKTVFDVDRGLWHTLKGLLLHPGEVINGYLEGRRIRYTNPFTLVLLFSGINAVLFPLLDFSGIARDVPGTQQVGSMTRLSFQYYSLLLLLLLPLASVCSRWVFAARGRNYAEHLIVNTYLTAEQAAFTACTFPLLAVLNHTPWFGAAYQGTLPLGLLYAVFGYVDVFGIPGARAKAVWRAIVTVVLYVSLFTLLGALGGYVYAQLKIPLPG